MGDLTEMMGDELERLLDEEGDRAAQIAASEALGCLQAFFTWATGDSRFMVGVLNEVIKESLDG